MIYNEWLNLDALILHEVRTLAYPHLAQRMNYRSWVNFKHDDYASSWGFTRAVEYQVSKASINNAHLGLYPPDLTCAESVLS